ncbi:MAG: (2Fe-2S)-binding protein [Actinomycetota bacterium]
MVVCHCHVIRDGELAELAAAGVRTLDELADHCDAGRRCGSCVETLTRILQAVEASDERAA